MSALLSLSGLNRRFGGLAAVSDFSLALESGIVTALVGPNGAGKTTIFNLVTGNLRVNSGQLCCRTSRSPACPRIGSPGSALPAASRICACSGI